MRIAAIVCVSAVSMGCSVRPWSGDDLRPLGNHHDINVTIKRRNDGECYVHKWKERAEGIQRNDTVYWRVSNSCRNTPVKITFKDADPLDDYAQNPGHEVIVPGESVGQPGFRAIMTVVKREPPGGTTERVFKYSISTPDHTIDPELIIDWP